MWYNLGPIISYERTPNGLIHNDLCVLVHFSRPVFLIDCIQSFHSFIQKAY